MERKTFSSQRDVLREMPLFRELSNKHLDGLARVTDEVMRPASSVLVKQGEFGLEFMPV